MATKMARRLTASSLSAAGIFVSSVNAEGKKVHPSDLDIYDKPSLVQEILMEEPPSNLEQKISSGRKWITNYWGSMKNIVGQGQSLAQTATVKTSEFMELISTNQTFQIKVTVISSGVLVGAIVAGRGRRPFKRPFYSALFGTIAFSACYPQKAWVISQKGFEQSKALFHKLKILYDERQQKSLSQTTEEKSLAEETKEIKGEEFVEEHPEPTPFVNPDTEPAPKEETISVIEDIKDIGTSTITSALDSDSVERSYLSYVPFLGWFFSGKSSEDSSSVKELPAVLSTEESSVGSEPEPVKSAVTGNAAKSELIVEDHGQSNPEDKDMYSTRE